MNEFRTNRSGERARITVGFDGRALTSPAAGIRRYARELFTVLAQLDRSLELVMLGGRAESAIEGVRYIPEPPHPPTNAGWMLVGVPLAMRRARVDLLHAPAYTAPFWGSAPVVLTIHDVSYARQPAWFPYRRDRLRRAFYRRSALNAARIITDSEFSASEIHAAYAIDRSRIDVVPLAASSTFSKGAGDDYSLPTGVSRPFVLHVGDLHERRNLPMLTRAVTAARRLSPQTAQLSLVLAGVDRGVGDSLRQIAVEAGAPEAVVLLGQVRDSILQQLYRDASALTYPSLYEGFGLPVLEAMAAGLPVLGSRAASIPEVLGDAGILLDPHAEQRWSEAIVRVISDRSLAVALSQGGEARAAGFTWEHTARQTLATYRRVLDSVAYNGDLRPRSSVG